MVAWVVVNGVALKKYQYFRNGRVKLELKLKPVKSGLKPLKPSKLNNRNVTIGKCHEIHKFRLPGDGFGFTTLLVCTKMGIQSSL